MSLYFFTLSLMDNDTPQPPMGIPTKNPDGAIRGAFTQLGILVERLFNLGVSQEEIVEHIREALKHAKHDGVGQEG